MHFRVYVTIPMAVVMKFLSSRYNNQDFYDQIQPCYRPNNQ